MWSPWATRGLFGASRRINTNHWQGRWHRQRSKPSLCLRSRGPKFANRRAAGGLFWHHGRRIAPAPLSRRDGRFQSLGTTMITTQYAAPALEDEYAQAALLARPARLSRQCFPPGHGRAAAGEPEITAMPQAADSGWVGLGLNGPRWLRFCTLANYLNSRPLLRPEERCEWAHKLLCRVNLSSASAPMPTGSPAGPDQSWKLLFWSSI